LETFKGCDKNKVKESELDDDNQINVSENTNTTSKPKTTYDKTIKKANKTPPLKIGSLK
jgi:hypothetical protein